MSWIRKVGHPTEVVQKGDKVTCVGAQRRPGAQADRPGPEADEATTRGRPTSPAATSPATVKKGKVTKLTNFGVFVELEPGLEGLLHISELADHKVESPEEVVKVGDEIEVKILRVDAASARSASPARRRSWTKPDGEEGAEGEAADPAAPRAEPASAASKELKGGLGGGGPLFSMGSPAQAESEAETQTADATTARLRRKARPPMC